MNKVSQSERSSDRRGPDQPDGIRRLHVGCGPKNILADWWNVDIHPFPGIDQILDVTRPWPFTGLEYVYSEHFLEHLRLEESIAFLNHVWLNLKEGGKIRLSTPSLEWVLSTHFNLSEATSQKQVKSTLVINRAFHGWGHQFLYSKVLLGSLLTNFGWRDVKYFAYGKSDDPVLVNLESHGNYSIYNGYPSVWIVEAARGNTRSTSDEEAYIEFLKEHYVKYVQK